MARQSKRHQKQEIVKYLQMGFKVRNACALAGVAHSTFYEWLKSDKRFRREVDRAKATPIARAEAVIQKALAEGNVRVAMWYLERSMPEYRLPRGVEPTQYQDEDVIVEYIEVPTPEINYDEWMERVLRGEE